MGVVHIILKVGHPKIILTQISEEKILMKPINEQKLNSFTGMVHG
jgi:hypothetical protein